jgi:hypothetical protein
MLPLHYPHVLDSFNHVVVPLSIEDLERLKGKYGTRQASTLVSFPGPPLSTLLGLANSFAFFIKLKSLEPRVASSTSGASSNPTPPATHSPELYSSSPVEKINAIQDPEEL